MIEFNVSGDDESLQRVSLKIKQIMSEQGLVDFVINIKTSNEILSRIPAYRLKQIVEIVETMSIDGPVTKSQICELLVIDGLSYTSASSYVSCAAGDGFIQRIKSGYLLTELGRSIRS